MQHTPSVPLDNDTLQKIQAGAFRSLCEHLQDRSDQVSNIDMMGLTGFCRNCLAKWMVLEARNLVNSGQISETKVKELLHTQFGYAQAAEYVYGMTYDSWKERHQQPATDAQLQTLNDNKALAAKHDKKMLETQENIPDAGISLESNVCCQDVPNIAPSVSATSSTAVPRRAPLPSPASLPSPLRVGILTVSDRASKNEYPDRSGPTLQRSVERLLQNIASLEFTMGLVPDETTDIQQWLRNMSTTSHLILTTGGTGMAPRDVTPEATRAVVDHENPGLMAHVLAQVSATVQPLACLSRGTSGVIIHTGSSNVLSATMVANLPGNPQAVEELVPMALPLLLHAVADIQRSSK